MKVGTIKILMIIWIPLMLVSCSAISKNIRQKAVPDLSFAELQHDADAFMGKTVILGGYILEIRNKPEETRLLVLQAPLGYQDQPLERDASQGRFVVVKEGFLDPAVYEKGRDITVAGQVIGVEDADIDEFSYKLPKIRAEEIHLWEPEDPDQMYYIYDPYLFPHPYGRWPSRYYRW